MKTGTSPATKSNFSRASGDHITARILAALKAEPEGMTLCEIAEAIGETGPRTGKGMSRLTVDRRVTVDQESRHSRLASMAGKNRRPVYRASAVGLSFLASLKP